MNLFPGKAIVWLEKARFGCVAFVILITVLFTVLGSGNRGSGFVVGALLGGVILYGGIVFVLWTFLILIAKLILRNYASSVEEINENDPEMTALAQEEWKKKT